jgi:4-amino-4-deoxy-L-arabinose transferase-like glycosyltransferase
MPDPTTSDAPLSPAPATAGALGGQPPLSRAVPTAAAVVLVAHIVTNLTSPYGIHRDALLYLAMGRHLSLFGMDFPPFIALAANATRALLGDSLTAIRMGPALAHAATVLVAGLAARQLGGRAWAQGVTVLAVAATPLFLRAGVLFQPVVFDQLWWTLGRFVLARIGVAAGHGADTKRLWLVLGAVLGIGLLTKFTILVLAAAILVALLLTPLRRPLATPWPWVAGVLAVALGSPSWIGQIRLGFPLFGQVADLEASQVARVAPSAYVLEQILEIGPALALAGASVMAIILAPRLRHFRAVIWTAALAWILMLLAGGKAYYIGPIYPMLIGVGAAEAERWVEIRFAQPCRAWPRRLARVSGDGVAPVQWAIMPPDASSTAAARRATWTAVAGLAVALAGVGTYFVVVFRLGAWLPRVRNDALPNWILVAAGLALGLRGLSRAPGGRRLLPASLLALSGLLAAAFAVMLYVLSALPDASGPAVGRPAPDFALRDQSGRTVRLRDFGGAPLLLVFYRGHW